MENRFAETRRVVDTDRNGDAVILTFDNGEVLQFEGAYLYSLKLEQGCLPLLRTQADLDDIS
ncbi:hypothetical protein D1Y84_02710 [Acidipila sp. EB88]|nr:hypothetical protein D1Y84_02710 [Acidipila sp. EB88]